MFPITITIHNQAQLAVVLGALGAIPAAATDAPQAATIAVEQTKTKPQEVAAPAGKSTRAATDKAAPAASQPTAAAGAATGAPEKTADASTPTAAPAAAEPQASTAAEPITYEKVAQAIVDGVKSNRQKVVDTLKKFGAAKGPELKPEQYAEFLAALGA